MTPFIPEQRHLDDQTPYRTRRARQSTTRWAGCPLWSRIGFASGSVGARASFSRGAANLSATEHRTVDSCWELSGVRNGPILWAVMSRSFCTDQRPGDSCDRGMVGVRLRSLVALAVVMTVSLGALDAAALAAGGTPIQTARVRHWPAALIRVVRSLVHGDEREPMVPRIWACTTRARPVLRPALDRQGWSPRSGLARLGLIDLPPPLMS